MPPLLSMNNLATPIPLQKTHDRTKFTCGEDTLDKYIQKQVSQDLRRKLCTCFVLVDENSEVVGYYTLSSFSLDRDEIPEEVRRKMPPAYKDLPMILLGRLAVAESQKGNGLGELLLVDALKRSYDISSSEIGAIAVVVDPINDSETFYEKYGFTKLPDSGKMFLPMTTVASLFN